MSVKNFYPQFNEIPYKKTSVAMPLVIEFAKSLISKYGKETVASALAIFKNESGNGSLGVNENYGGIQADNTVWQGLDLTNVIGTSVIKDNFGDTRRFICFNENGYKTCFDFLCMKVSQRGLFIGGKTHKYSNIEIKTPQDLTVAYNYEWVGRNANDVFFKVAKILSDNPTYVFKDKEWINAANEYKDFISIYNTSVKNIT